ELPDSVKQTLQSIIDKIREMLPQGESSLGKFIEAVKARVGELAAKAKEAYEKAKKIYDQVKADFDKYKKEFEQLKEFYEATRDAVQTGDKAWGEGKEAVARCKDALQKVEKRDFDGARQSGTEARIKLELAKQDAESCSEKAQHAYEKLPEQVKTALEQ